MAEKKNANLRKSNKHLYDMNSGLPIMINLYVIKYIYYHIDKADRFFEKKEKGKKPRAYPIYQAELPISRQRFDRINKGYQFEITSAESIFITDRFGINIKYFRKDNPDTFLLQEISQTEWKCFYNHEYEVGYELPSGYKKDIIKAKAEKVKAVLERITKRGWEERIKKDDPLYAICYYFHYGVRYDAPSDIDLFRERASNLKVQEWDTLSIEQLKNDYEMLEKHCKYVKSLITIKELKEN